MRIFSTIFFLLIICTFSFAQNNGDARPDLLAVDSAFVDGRYDQVELMVLRILHSDAELTPDERARLNLTAGYALIMLNRENEARGYFANALDAVPDLTLDPVQVSPKFRMVFDEVKATRPSGESGDSPRRMGETETVLRVAPRSQVMNLIVPGSGQWQEGYKIRGAAAFTLQAATVGILIWKLGKMSDSRSDYLAETDPVRIASAYDDYNSNYRQAWAAGIAAGVVYLAAQADLAFLKPAAPKMRTLSVIPSPGGLSLCFAW